MNKKVEKLIELMLNDLDEVAQELNMQIGKFYISKIYRTQDRFTFGISFETSNHIHNKNEEGNFQEIVKWKLEEVKEIVIMIEFLFWGMDIQISE